MSAVASILVPIFLVVPIAGVMAEENGMARTTTVLTSDLSLGGLHDSCFVPSEEGAPQEQWITDECFEYLLAAGAACIIAGAISVGVICGIAIYLAVTGCTCLASWGVIQILIECYRSAPGGPLIATLGYLDYGCLIDKCTLLFDDGSECEDYCGPPTE